MPRTIVIDARLRELTSRRHFPPPSPDEALLVRFVVFMAEVDDCLSLFVAYPGVRQLYVIQTLLMLTPGR